MLIKNTILEECHLYTQQPRRDVLFTNHRQAVSQTKIRLMGVHHRISNQDPLWLLCNAMLRHYTPGDDFDRYYGKVSSNQEGLALEAMLVAESTSGKYIPKIYFGDKSLTIGVLEVSEPDSVTLNPIHILNSHDTTVGGITPLTRRHRCYGDYTIVYSLYLISKILFDKYLTNSELVDGKVLFSDNLSDFIYRNYYIPSIDSCLERSMFNRYSALLNRNEVEDKFINQGFAVSDYTKQLNETQLKLVEAVSYNDVRKAFTLLPIGPNKVLLDLLEEDLSIAFPLNHQWTEVINELKWAEFYLDLGGGRGAIDNAIKLYLRKLKSRNVIGGCPYGPLKEGMEMAVKVIEFSLP